MNHFQQAIIGVAVAAIATGAWVFRYDVVPVGRGGDGTIIAGYQLDRWTGEVKVLMGARFTPVIEREKSP
jgi:hypothetical protein